MRFLQKLQQLLEAGKSQEELQKELSVAEVWNLWRILLTRYRIIETTQFYISFAADQDFKVILGLGLEELNEQMEKLELLLQHYNIPMPQRPVKAVTTVARLDDIKDRQIFQSLFVGIQSFISLYSNAYMQTSHTIIRQKLKEFLLAEIEMFDNLFEYGKIKGWLEIPPAFRVC